jgi:hypothetical protein
VSGIFRGNYVIRNLAALGLPLCLAAPAAAQSIQAKQFGAREMIRDVSVSPDGQRVAMVVATGTRGTGLIVSSPDGQLKTILNEPGDPLIRLTHCAWSTSTRLVCTLFGIVGPRIRSASAVCSQSRRRSGKKSHRRRMPGGSGHPSCCSTATGI